MYVFVAARAGPRGALGGGSGAVCAKGCARRVAPSGSFEEEKGSVVCSMPPDTRGSHPELYDAAASAAGGDGASFTEPQCRTGALKRHRPVLPTQGNQTGLLTIPAAFRHWPCASGCGYAMPGEGSDRHLKSDLASAAEAGGVGAAGSVARVGRAGARSARRGRFVSARRRGRAESNRLRSGAGNSPRVVRAGR